MGENISNWEKRKKGEYRGITSEAKYRGHLGKVGYPYFL